MYRGRFTHYMTCSGLAMAYIGWSPQPEVISIAPTVPRALAEPIFRSEHRATFITLFLFFNL